MLSVNDLKGLLEVNKIATLPFIVAAYFQEFGFGHFPDFIPRENVVSICVMFVVIVIIAFIALSAAFDLVNILSLKLHGAIFSLVAASLLSFAVLGFFAGGEKINIHVSWFVAAGACGLYLLDVKRKSERAVAEPRTGT